MQRIEPFNIYVIEELIVGGNQCETEKKIVAISIGDYDQETHIDCVIWTHNCGAKRSTQVS